MEEIKYVYVRTPGFKKAYKNTYSMRIADDADYRDIPHDVGCKETIFTPEEFKAFCKDTEFLSIAFGLRNQTELDFFTDALSLSKIGTFEPHFPDRAQIVLSPLSRLKNTRRVFLVELPRIVSLWDTRGNTVLEELHILNCNRLHDFSILEGSPIETLKLSAVTGCRRLQASCI